MSKLTQFQWPFSIPSANQTWQWKMDHLSVVFLLVIKPPSIGDFPSLGIHSHCDMMIMGSNHTLIMVVNILRR